MTTKIFQIATGLLACLSLINGIVCLFTQPFMSTVTNDRVFFASLIVGFSFTALFLWADNQINGTINNPKLNS